MFTNALEEEVFQNHKTEWVTMLVVGILGTLLNCFVIIATISAKTNRTTDFTKILLNIQFSNQYCVLSSCFLLMQVADNSNRYYLGLISKLGFPHVVNQIAHVLNFGLQWSSYFTLILFLYNTAIPPTSNFKINKFCSRVIVVLLYVLNLIGVPMLTRFRHRENYQIPGSDHGTTSPYYRSVEELTVFIVFFSICLAALIFIFFLLKKHKGSPSTQKLKMAFFQTLVITMVFPLIYFLAAVIKNQLLHHEVYLDEKIRVIFVICSYANSAFTSLLYILFMKPVRHAAINILHLRLHNWNTIFPGFFMFYATLICTFVLTTAHFRIGHLISFGAKERNIISKCFPNNSIQLSTREACHHFNGLENAAVLHYSVGVDVLTGAFCDEESLTISQLASRWNKIYISTSNRLVDVRENTTISLQPNSPKGLAGALIALCRDRNWTNIGIAHDSYNTDMSLILATEFQKRSVSTNVTINVEIGEYHWFDRILDNSRVLIVLCDIDMFVDEVLTNIYEFERPSEFIVLFIDRLRNESKKFFEKILERKTENNRKREIIHIYLIQALHHMQSENGVEKWASSHNIKMDEKLESYLLMCDAFSILSHINTENETVDSLWTQITQHTDHGFSGPIFISPLGGRQPFLNIYGYYNSAVVIAGRIHPQPQECTSSDICVYHNFISTEFSNVTIQQTPPSFPICDFDGSLCSKKVIYLICLGVVALLIIPLYIAYYLQKKEREMMKMPWRIAHEDLTFHMAENDHPGFRRISTASGQKTSTSESPHLLDKRYAYFCGGRMYIHVYQQKKPIIFSREEMERLNQLKYSNHPNVNSFGGVSFNQHMELFVLWSYCNRGSLDDVLFRTERKLGRNFQANFIKHILNGLQYIHHSSIKVHGSLLLSNCVVDSYWIVKLTDFGVHDIIRNKMTHKDLSHPLITQWESVPREYLQMPPEYLKVLLETKDRYSIVPSITGDIYQVGMLIYQILFLRRPYQERGEGLEELMDRLTSDSPIHPHVPENSKEFTLRIVSIMQQCWLHKTSARPALFKITDAVAREFGKDGGALIDQLIKMVDEYQDNLEQIVVERTKKMEEEHEKTEQLLHTILPRELADNLRDGRQVKPRLHHSVSILVVDVCQFSELCDTCIPVHVLEILQQLYSSFDSIITRFRALKVENVGDAYLLISGIPEVHNNSHLAEVCSIALKLKEFMKTFVIIHRPDHKMRVKMGISCGAVAAGVLGIASPRFCVFGESVNMACRMAGTGLPGKVQVSEIASEIIRHEYLEIRVEERGTVILKGKGPVTTYWLLDDTDELAPKDPHNVV